MPWYLFLFRHLHISCSVAGSGQQTKLSSSQNSPVLISRLYFLSLLSQLYFLPGYWPISILLKHSDRLQPLSHSTHAHWNWQLYFFELANIFLGSSHNTYVNPHSILMSSTSQPLTGVKVVSGCLCDSQGVGQWQLRWSGNDSGAISAFLRNFLITRRW